MLYVIGRTRYFDKIRPFLKRQSPALLLSQNRPNGFCPAGNRCRRPCTSTYPDDYARKRCNAAMSEWKHGSGKSKVDLGRALFL